MSIIKIDSDDVLHRCDACGFERTIDFALIEVGVVPDADGRLDIDGDDRADPVVAFPSCNKCGSVELLHLPSENDPIERNVDMASLWERLGGEPLELAADGVEPSTDDIDVATDDYRSIY